MRSRISRFSRKLLDISRRSQQTSKKRGNCLSDNVGFYPFQCMRVPIHASPDTTILGIYTELVQLTHGCYGRRCRDKEKGSYGRREGGGDRFSPFIYLTKTGQSAVTIDGSKTLVLSLYINKIAMFVCLFVCLFVCPLSPSREIYEYRHNIHGSKRNLTGKVLIYIWNRTFHYSRHNSPKTAKPANSSCQDK